jgi:hypothetical protein
VKKKKDLQMHLADLDMGFCLAELLRLGRCESQSERSVLSRDLAVEQMCQTAQLPKYSTIHLSTATVNIACGCGFPQNKYQEYVNCKQV